MVESMYIMGHRCGQIKTAVQNQMVKITTEIQTPDSDDDLSGPRSLWAGALQAKLSCMYLDPISQCVILLYPFVA